MRGTKKIILLCIIMVVLSTIILPTIVNIFEKLNINRGNLFRILSDITDSMIVKASDTDYNYSGNLRLQINDSSYFVYSSRFY